MVTGADVCEPPVPGPAVMVVDTPDAASLAAVAAHPRLLSAAVRRGDGGRAWEKRAEGGSG